MRRLAEYLRAPQRALATEINRVAQATLKASDRVRAAGEKAS